MIYDLMCVSLLNEKYYFDNVKEDNSFNNNSIVYVIKRFFFLYSKFIFWYYGRKNESI